MQRRRKTEEGFTLERCTLSDLQELAAAARVNPNLEKSELARNICATYCTIEEGNDVCSDNEHSELGMSETNTNEVGTEGRPIHANGGGQAVGTQSAAGSEQQTSPPAQHVETTGQRNLDAFLDRNLKGEEFESGLLNNLQQCSLEIL